MSRGKCTCIMFLTAISAECTTAHAHALAFRPGWPWGSYLAIHTGRNGLMHTSACHKSSTQMYFHVSYMLLW